jgi:microsomal dipeptidase-like Zn-dependent dipeptidase
MNRYPLDLRHSGDFPKLCCALEQSGFSQQDVRKIMYENLFRYISQFI